MSNYTRNQHAYINSRATKNNKLRTETVNREDELNMAMTTDKKTNATSLFVDIDGGAVFGGETLKLNGSEARTLFRLLAKHYSFTGKSLHPVKAKVEL